MLFCYCARIKLIHKLDSRSFGIVVQYNVLLQVDSRMSTFLQRRIEDVSVEKRLKKDEFID
jgi:hypothetical protein